MKLAFRRRKSFLVTIMSSGVTRWFMVMSTVARPVTGSTTATASANPQPWRLPQVRKVPSGPSQ